MLAELRDDNQQLIGNMRTTHDLCDEHGDVATASLIEVWIDEAERRALVPFEARRQSGEKKPVPGPPPSGPASGGIQSLSSVTGRKSTLLATSTPATAVP